jgi:hypothetical protein
MINRNIDVHTNSDPGMNKNGPLIAFFYDENKVEVFMGQLYSLINKITIS